MVAHLAPFALDSTLILEVEFSPADARIGREVAPLVFKGFEEVDWSSLVMARHSSPQVAAWLSATTVGVEVHMSKRLAHTEEAPEDVGTSARVNGVHEHCI